MSIRRSRITNEVAHIKNQIDSDFIQVLNNTTNSFFAVPLLVFSMVDYLGSLYRGNNSSANAVAFLREYFGRVNAAYNSCSGLLYFVYRHGLVHQRMPKLTQLRTNGRRLSCYITRTETNRHLRGFRMLNESARGLIICLQSLILDLKQAVEIYEVDLLSDTQNGRILRRNFSTSYNLIRSYHQEDNLLTDQRTRYVQAQDFTFVREQLRNPITF